jgi:hypothetical protein
VTILWIPVSAENFSDKFRYLSVLQDGLFSNKKSQFG